MDGLEKELLDGSLLDGSLHSYEASGWVCHLFGGDGMTGIAYRPAKGQVPNLFVRWLMKVCFACTWIKDVE